MPYASAHSSLREADMPSFAGELTLDFCEVETKAVSLDDIVKAARTEPRDVDDWYMTLTRDDDHWMDATMDDATLFGVRCEEGGKVVECSGIDATKLEAVFVSFYEGGGAWKTICDWREKKKKEGFLQKLFKSS